MSNYRYHPRSILGAFSQVITIGTILFQYLLNSNLSGNYRIRTDVFVALTTALPLRIFSTS
jgi:hypothetical protein